MQFWRSFSSVLRVSDDNPELIRAQHAALGTQVPLLYLILIINTVLLAVAHAKVAPAALTFGFPLLLAVVCARRGVAWAKSRGVAPDDAEILTQLKQTVILGGLLGVVFVGWALALFGYGDATARGHVIFYIGITSISCILCLMHLPPAALLVTSVVTVPFATFLVLSDTPGVTAVAVNLLVVVATLVYVLLVYARDFRTMISAQTALARKSAETERLSEENRRLANIDSLTGLANRRRFFSEFETVLAAARASGARFHIGIVDLDGFKPVNDSYGHKIGDAVLREVGARLEALGGDEAFFARLGGDEFAAIVPRLSGAALEEFGERICRALRQPFRVETLEIEISSTIGFAVHPDAGATVEVLYERADYALYHAKLTARGGMMLFTPELGEELQNTKTVEAALARADLEAEMYLEYQPMFDVNTGRPTAFEALARWRSPTLGLVAPAMFVHVAERSAAIHRITQTLLAKALKAAQEWPDDVQLSFNLSVRDLTSREAILAIVSLVERSGFPPRRLVLEITETALIRDYDAARESLDLLKALGVKISLDDFGTGYSSLSYVHRLPLDKIKIDRSFVQALSSHLPTRDIIRTILSLCQNLQLTCIVEGMETPAEVEILRGLGCTTMQGYFFARPTPADEVARFFEKPEAASAA
ncbi:MAG: EAL domain-containing protein [Rhizobiales bacterium]|nr:EAL domain-containing protein [Hyphomicrobiales bacterium]